MNLHYCKGEDLDDVEAIFKKTPEEDYDDTQPLPLRMYNFL